MPITKESGLHGELLEEFKNDLLIIFLKRLKGYGDELTFTVEEVDNVAGDKLAFSVVDKVFHFEVTPKK